ncbi:sugar ABC transporter permease [Beijerinckia sp. L45]|uniref:sugar ABC transporter permease n=1 Tax=Beijerinckia sp. L45 TaxID=1641855 RepID=UPI00131D86D6|nr:sugar ABC transporter permease [Beijerinckia sp. L45]
MLGALAVIWIGFDVLSGGVFLTPRNIWNLSVQSASVAVMAAGMVLVIVTRNIDLSVGSILGFTGMIIGVTQVWILPTVWGLEHPLTWIVSVIVGIIVGAAIGTVQGAVVAYLGVPSFIVTLGGLLVWRGMAWRVAEGQTIAPLDSRFLPLGGGMQGSVGAAASWIIGGVAMLVSVILLVTIRRRRKSFGFIVRPVWAEILIAALVCGAIAGAVLVVNAYPLPPGIVRTMLEAQGLPSDGPLPDIAHGFAIPVLIAVAVGIVMTFIADRTRFGRYVFAIGGNPEAADLSGINTRRVLTLVFTLMGALCGLSAAIATARLQAATNANGTLDELYTIAAAVIGGTSLSGGTGTIFGAMLGAVIAQSLQTGMVLLGVDAPMQNVVVGLVLVAAVYIDTVYRRRIK